MAMTIIKKTPPRPREPHPMRIISKTLPEKRRPERRGPRRCPVCGTTRGSTEEMFNVSGRNLTCKVCGSVCDFGGNVIRIPT